jgi:hypothetical protein
MNNLYDFHNHTFEEKFLQLRDLQTWMKQCLHLPLKHKMEFMKSKYFTLKFEVCVKFLFSCWTKIFFFSTIFFSRSAAGGESPVQTNISLEVVMQEILALKQLVLEVKEKQEILSAKQEVHS